MLNLVKEKSSGVAMHTSNTYHVTIQEVAGHSDNLSHWFANGTTTYGSSNVSNDLFVL
jgi:hypothetical protein